MKEIPFMYVHFHINCGPAHIQQVSGRKKLGPGTRFLVPSSHVAILGGRWPPPGPWEALISPNPTGTLPPPSTCPDSPSLCCG